MGWLLPTMDKEKLDLQRDVVKNERRQSYDNVPYGRAYETILPVMFPSNHPYSWPVIGSLADLSAASVTDVSDFFRQYYAPNNATITIAGDFNADSAKTWVRTYFGNIPRNAEIARPTVPAVALTKDTVMMMEDRVQLPRAYYVWHSVKTFSPDDAALDALTDIIAGGKSSRLYRTLVYEKQIAQDVSMGNSSSKLDGMLMLTATAKPGVHPRELDAEIAKVIAEVAAHGVTERELTRVKNGMRASTIDRLSRGTRRTFPARSCSARRRNSVITTTSRARPTTWPRTSNATTRSRLPISSAWRSSTSPASQRSCSPWCPKARRTSR